LITASSGQMLRALGLDVDAGALRAAAARKPAAPRTPQNKRREPLGPVRASKRARQQPAGAAAGGGEADLAGRADESWRRAGAVDASVLEAAEQVGCGGRTARWERGETARAWGTEAGTHGFGCSSTARRSCGGAR
jgi:hypothetical protein